MYTKITLCWYDDFNVKIKSKQNSLNYFCAKTVIDINHFDTANICTF